MFLNLYAKLTGVAQSTHFSGSAMQANQTRMGLANMANPNMTPVQVQGVQNIDKALEMQAIQSKTMYEAASLMAEAAASREKKEFDRRRQAIQNGSLF